MNPNQKQAINQLYQMMDMGGSNSGCLVEPIIFSKRLKILPEQEIRNILQALDTLLDASKAIWDKDLTGTSSAVSSTPMKTNIKKPTLELLTYDHVPDQGGGKAFSYTALWSMSFFRDGMARAKHKLRMEINRDFYDFQSHAQISRWDGDRWCFVDSIPYTSMACMENGSSYSDDEKTLLARAELVLQP